MAADGTTFLYVALGLVLGIAVYYLFRWATGNTSTRMAAQSTYLKTQAAAMPISDFSSPLAVRCTYSFWLLVNNLAATALTTIFTITDGASPATQIAALTLDNKATLTFSKGAAATAKTYHLDDNFPLQKWTRLDLSFDNRRFDFYLDGKLLRSYQMPSTLVTPAAAVIQFGAIDAYIQDFSRAAEPIDPATAHAKYLDGQKSLSGSALPSYGVSVQLVKDSVVQKSLTLF